MELQSRDMPIPPAGEGGRSRDDVDGVPFFTSVVEPSAPGRPATERELIDQSVSVTVQDRGFWSSGLKEVGFVVVRDIAGAPVLGFSLRATRSRALPGYSVLRVRRLGGSADERAVRAGVRAAARFARTRGRVLRLGIELFIPDGAARNAVSAECMAQGMAPAQTMRSYAETILIDLDPTPDELFAGLSKTGRQNVRAVDKNPVAIRVIDDVRLAPRLDALLNETMARTGGGARPHDWPSIIDWSRRYPRAIRLAGLFDERTGTAEPLLAFALGFNHGDYTEYATAASTRETDLRMPLAYGLAWELMLWGKSAGARWFDFGGVTRGTQASGDVLGGISDFKRYFSSQTVEVGAEYVLEPHRLPALAARVSGTLARWFSGEARGLVGP
jgi:hypothetical protein